MTLKVERAPVSYSPPGTGLPLDLRVLIQYIRVTSPQLVGCHMCHTGDMPTGVAESATIRNEKIITKWCIFIKHYIV